MRLCVVGTIQASSDEFSYKLPRMHGSRKIPTSFSDKILRKRVCRKFSSIFRRAFRIITENAWFWENSNKIFREDTEKTGLSENIDDFTMNFRLSR